MAGGKGKHASTSTTCGSNPKRVQVEARSEQLPTPDAVLVFCLTQTPGPLQALAIANHALQGYCVTHALIRLIYDEYLLPVFNVGVWHAEQGFELQSIVTALYKLVGQEWEIPGDNVPFPGSTMLVGPLDQNSETELQEQLLTGWTSHPEGDANPFELFTVSVWVTQEGVNLIHMYEIKAFRKVQQSIKTWVVLDVLPNFVPFIVTDLESFLQNPARLVEHLHTSFSAVAVTDIYVYGVKGKYADRSFIQDSAPHIGLPYMGPVHPETTNIDLPFFYKVYDLANLQPYLPVMVQPVDISQDDRFSRQKNY
jgi:hypothetical protein